jgi:hypothetical protein
MGQKGGKRWEKVVEQDEEVMSWNFGRIHSFMVNVT